jgi:hypothetical protein
MSLSAVVIGICGIPWLAFGFAEFQKRNEIRLRYTDLPRPRSRLRDPLGYSEIKELALFRRLDDIRPDLQQAMRYRRIHMSAFALMLLAFLIDFSRNMFLK